MSKSTCGRKAEKPAFGAVVWSGRDEGMKVEFSENGKIMPLI